MQQCGVEVFRRLVAGNADLDSGEYPADLLEGRPFFLKVATILGNSAPGSASRDPESSNSHAFDKTNTPSSYFRER
jgi:hypothetical protein